MKCVYIPRPKEIYIKEIKKPEIKKEEVLIKVHSVGLCGTDLHSFRGTQALAKYPLIPGHEIAGSIVETGEDVPDDFIQGLHVTVKPYINCEGCYPCSINRINCCRDSVTLGLQIPGALCEYIAVNYKNVILAQDIDYMLLALVEPLAVGAHLCHRVSVSAGEYVVVYGCGVIGLGAISAAYFRNANVIAVDIVDEKLEIAKSMGAKYQINSKKQNVQQAVREITGGEDATVVMEAIGLEATMAQAVEVICFAGRIGYVGYGKGALNVDSNLIVKKELNIFGSRNALQAEFNCVIDSLRLNVLPFNKLVTQTFKLEDADKAFWEWNKDPKGFIKIQISFSEDEEREKIS